MSRQKMEVHIQTTIMVCAPHSRKNFLCSPTFGPTIITSNRLNNSLLQSMYLNQLSQCCLGYIYKHGLGLENANLSLKTFN